VVYCKYQKKAFIMADVIALRVSAKCSITISRGDESKLAAGKLIMFFQYARIGSVSVHSLIIGPRPNSIPKDWVIDHVDRNKLNNTRENLRWVSRSFNAFNTVRHSGVSRFRGVSFRHGCKSEWRASVGGVNLGHFTSEREAAIIAATAYIRAYGKWAETSDLLFTFDQTLPDLLSLEELADIKRSIAAEDALLPAPVSTTKSTGVYKTKSGKFRVEYRQSVLGYTESFIAAVVFREEQIKAILEREWHAYKSLPIPLDDDGDAVIALSDGKWGSGVKSKVDAEFWHQLTYKTCWCLTSQRYARRGRDSQFLHKAVMLLIDSEYVSNWNASIDHIDPTAKLDNRRVNLRVATHAEQQRNKVTRTGGTSIHKGVYAIKTGWVGTFGYTTSAGPQLFRVPVQQTEEEVVRRLNAVRSEVHGDNAVDRSHFMRTKA
jgi:hypothetical protein